MIRFEQHARRNGKGNTATFAIIPAREAIPPCLDAGWIAPPIEVDLHDRIPTDADLADADALERWAQLPHPGVEVLRVNGHDERLVVRHRRPSVTTL